MKDPGKFLPWVAPVTSLIMGVFTIGIVWGSLKDIPQRMEKAERMLNILCKVSSVTHRVTVPKEFRIDFSCPDGLRAPETSMIWPE
jgi:hypothetical protein